MEPDCAVPGGQQVVVGLAGQQLVSLAGLQICKPEDLWRALGWSPGNPLLHQKHPFPSMT